jgi:hypothetical protein
LSNEKQLEVSRVVSAPAERVFALLADPRRHVVIDGSGMLQSSDSEPITAAGQVFTMNMHHNDLGSYQTMNTVTEFVPNVRLGWAPNLDPSCDLATKLELAGITPGGHTYTYRLSEVDCGTEVVQTYDWSGVTDPKFEAFCPFVNREQLADTLAKLARAVEDTAIEVSSPSG